LHNDLAREQIVEGLAQELGVEAARQPDISIQILPDLMRATGRVFRFAKGFAEATTSLEETWNVLLDEFAKVPFNQQRVTALSGFLSGVKDRDAGLLQTLLEAAIADDRTARWFPALQAQSGIDEVAIDRLRRSFALKKAPVYIFRSLSMGKVTSGVADAQLASLLFMIDSAPAGNEIAIEILAMHIFGAEHSEQSETIRDAGRRLLANLSFEGEDGMRDHRAAIVAAHSLRGAEGEECARELLAKLIARSADPKVRVSNFHDLVVAVTNTHPKVALDSFLLGDRTNAQLSAKALRSITRGRRHPFSKISSQDVLAWCNVSPSMRFPLAASAMPLIKEHNGRIEWSELSPTGTGVCRAAWD
jgi:hypothetical protein